MMISNTEPGNPEAPISGPSENRTPRYLDQRFLAQRDAALAARQEAEERRGERLCRLEAAIGLISASAWGDSGRAGAVVDRMPWSDVEWAEAIVKAAGAWLHVLTGSRELRRVLKPHGLGEEAAMDILEMALDGESVEVIAELLGKVRKSLGVFRDTAPFPGKPVCDTEQGIRCLFNRWYEHASSHVKETEERSTREARKCIVPSRVALEAALRELESATIDSVYTAVDALRLYGLAGRLTPRDFARLPALVSLRLGTPSQPTQLPRRAAPRQRLASGRFESALCWTRDELLVAVRAWLADRRIAAVQTDF